MTCAGCALKSDGISSIDKDSMRLRNLLEKYPRNCHFAREIAVSENVVLLFVTRFLKDPLSVLESP